MLFFFLYIERKEFLNNIMYFVEVYIISVNRVGMKIFSIILDFDIILNLFLYL